MIRPSMVLALARAETRLTRRLVRYWVFVGAAALVGVGGYTYYALLHWQVSSYSASAAMLNPRYLIAAIGIYYMLVFLYGLLFLGFDVRARDTRERIVEVIDSKPCSNLELLLGKLIGLVVPSWIPVAIICLVLGLVGRAVDEPLEPWSLVGFVTLLAIPAFVFVAGLTFLVTLLLRHRGLAALVLMALLFGIYAAIFGLPIYMTPLVDVMGAYMSPFPSEIVPQVVDIEGFIQRVGILLAGLAFVWLAAALHPRLDDASRTGRAVTGLVMLLVAVGLCGGLALGRKGQLNRRDRWQAVHAARSSERAPDLLAMEGRIGIEPGRELTLDLRLRFRAPAETTLERAIFSLNPGLAIEELRDEARGAVAHSAADGLVDITLPAALGPGAEATLVMKARGRPDMTFAYLDEVIRTAELNPWNGQLLILGYEPSLFDRRYVALLPGVRWLPATGSEIGRSDPRVRSTDFYQMDLIVELPEGWLAAAPGRREKLEAEAPKRVSYRFAPAAPVPDVALVAGRFESRSMELQGVRLETLVHPSHAGNIEFFEDAAPQIRRWIGERLEEAAELGLPYPYEALTLVESPTTLRGYAGGWRMDSAMSQPGLILMRESSFPTTRFDTRFKDPKSFEDREGGIAQAKIETLERYFNNDFSGGNPFLAAARSFFGFQTAGSGSAGLPLDFVCETLASRLLAEQQGFFSAHIYNSVDFNKTLGQAFQSFFTQRRSKRSFADAVIEAVTSRIEVWDTLLGTSLAELDPWQKPRNTIDVLTLKGGAMARSVFDNLGREKTGQLLGGLRSRGEGAAFSREDVVAAGQAVGEDLDDWLDVWIDETTLPGFAAGAARLNRISDTEDGSPRYQLVVPVRNGEPASGLLRLAYRTGTGRDAEWDQSDSVRVNGHAAVEIGLVSPSVPREVRLEPYLSLNRRPFGVSLPAVSEEKIVERDPFSGVRDIEWDASNDDAVIVDDLDEGFSIEESGQRPWWRFGGRPDDVVTDQGLPVLEPNTNPTYWSRQDHADAFGRYRHTLAVTRAGNGEQRAIFATALERAGSFRLALHVPEVLTQAGGRRGRRSRLSLRRGKLGTLQLVIADDFDQREVSFDAKGGEAGWNDLGRFELGAGEVRVEISNETDGDLVFADAIRWSRADRGVTP